MYHLEIKVGRENRAYILTNCSEATLWQKQQIGSSREQIRFILAVINLQKVCIFRRKPTGGSSPVITKKKFITTSSHATLQILTLTRMC